MNKDYSKLVYNGVYIRLAVSYNSTIKDLGRYYVNVYLGNTPIVRPEASYYIGIM